MQELLTIQNLLMTELHMQPAEIDMLHFYELKRYLQIIADKK